MPETNPQDLLTEGRRLTNELRVRSVGAHDVFATAADTIDRLAAEVERQRAALAFYMNAWERERGGDIGPAQELLDDRGEKARAALHPTKEPSNG